MEAVVKKGRVLRPFLIYWKSGEGNAEERNRAAASKMLYADMLAPKEHFMRKVDAAETLGASTNW